jgi:hypothetical protein
MATVTITNTTDAAIYLNDIFNSVQPGAANAVTITRAPGQIPNMYGLMQQVQQGNMTVTVVYSAADLDSGLMTIPAGSGPASSGNPSLGAELAIRMPFTSVIGDVTVYAAGKLPGQMRVLAANLFVSTDQSGSTVALWTGPGGTGTDVASFSGAATGNIAPTGGSLQTGTVDITPSATTGLFLHSATAGVIGELVLKVQFGA